MAHIVQTDKERRQAEQFNDLLNTAARAAKNARDALQGVLVMTPDQLRQWKAVHDALESTLSAISYKILSSPQRVMVVAFG